MFSTTTELLIAAGVGSVGSLLIKGGWSWIAPKLQTFFSRIDPTLFNALQNDVTNLKAELVAIKAKLGA
jgi:hypothetical protein